MIEECDLAVIGAGPSGLAAAMAAAQSGIKVSLIDSNARIGGQYLKQLPVMFKGSDTLTHQHELAAIENALNRANVRVNTNTVVWDCRQDEPGWLLYTFGSKGPSRLRLRALVIATGAYDRPVPFPGWTLPGVLTTGAVQNLIKSQRVLPGARFVVAATGPLGLAVAANLVKAGAEVAMVLEASPRLSVGSMRYLPRMWGQWPRIREGASYVATLLSAHVPVRVGWAAIEARGNESVENVLIAPLHNDWRPDRSRQQVVSADTLVIGYGFSPNHQFTRLIGCRFDDDKSHGESVLYRDADLQTSLAGVFAAGDGVGIGGAVHAQLEGEIAGYSAAKYLGGTSQEIYTHLTRQTKVRLDHERRFVTILDDLFKPGPGLHTLADDDTVICRCEQVRLREIKAAIKSGVHTANGIKGLTRAGMGNCQGRMCSSSISYMLAEAVPKDHDPGIDGVFTPRSPLVPLPLSVLADESTD